jgi:hypothetical protein
VTDHRLGDDEAEVRARDRISALAHGFRILSEAGSSVSACRSDVRRLGDDLAGDASRDGADRAGPREGSDDRQLSAATYRICQREAVDRAYAHSFTPRRELAKIERSLPILDCDPNAHGRPARPLSAAAQRVFVRRFMDGRLSLREQGICRDRLPTSPDEPIC